MLLRARKPTIADCIFMSLSVFRDRSPEIMVVEVPDMLAKAIPPTPSTEVLRWIVTSAWTTPLARPKIAPSASSAAD